MHSWDCFERRCTRVHPSSFFSSPPFFVFVPFSFSKFPSLSTLHLPFFFQFLFKFILSFIFSLLSFLHFSHRFMPSILAHILLPFLHIFFLHVVDLLQYSLPSSFIGFSFLHILFASFIFSPLHLIFSLFPSFYSFPSSPLSEVRYLTFLPIYSFLHFLFFALLPLLSSSSSRLSFLHLSHKFTSRSLSSHIFIPCIFSLDNPCLDMSIREDLIQQYGKWRGVLLRMMSFFTIL